MEATTIFLPANPRLPHGPFYYKTGRVRTTRFIINAKQDNGGSGRDNDGKSVDDGMVVLRMRIKKMKALEATSGGADKEEGVAPVPASDWKEWEKKLVARYQEGVGESMEALQSYLMKTRPSVALGMLALAALTVPLSGSAVMASALKVARGLLAGCHVCIDIDF